MRLSGLAPLVCTAAQRRSSCNHARRNSPPSAAGAYGRSLLRLDVAFHRALVDGAGNPVLSYQLAGAVEAMQPLMNMITFSARDRARIVALHTDIADALEGQDADATFDALKALEIETQSLAQSVFQARKQKSAV